MSDKLITIFLLLVTLTFSLTLKAQDNEIDSLKFALKNAKHDTIKINILSELSGLCEVEDILLFAEPCLKLCESLKRQVLYSRKRCAKLLIQSQKTYKQK